MRLSLCSTGRLRSHFHPIQNSLFDRHRGRFWMNQSFVDIQIVTGHLMVRKVELEMFSASPTIDFMDSSNCIDRLGNISHNETAYTIRDDLRHGAERIRYHGSTASHSLDHDQAEWLRPLNRKQK